MFVLLQKIFTYVEVFGTIIRNVYGMTILIEVGPELVSLDGSFYGSNNNKLEGLLFGESLASNNGKVVVYDESIKLVLSIGKRLDNILGIGYGILFGMNERTETFSLHGSYDSSRQVPAQPLPLLLHAISFK